MANNYMQPGNVMDYLNTSTSAVLSGAVVVFADCVGVALSDIPAAELGSVQLTGVFLLPKSSDVLVQGALCYWSDTGVTSTASDVVAGRVWVSAAANDAVVAVKLAG